MSEAGTTAPRRRVVAALILGPTDPNARMQASLRLFQRGTDVVWIALDDGAMAEHCDALMVFGDAAGADPGAADKSVPLVRRFWLAGKSLAFFGSNESLLARARLVAEEAPGELGGVVSDAQGPGMGAIDEFVDAMSAQPHRR
jgi:hypothetical protein